MEQQFYDRYRWAEDLFAHRDYRAAARVLEALLDEAAERPDEVGHGLAEARLLLARTLERGSRDDEAGAAFRVAEALGAPA